MAESSTSLINLLAPSRVDFSPSSIAAVALGRRAAGSEYMQIRHLFTFKREMMAHLASFSQAALRDPATLSPAIRELTANGGRKMELD